MVKVSHKVNYKEGFKSLRNQRVMYEMTIVKGDQARAVCKDRDVRRSILCA